MLAQPVLILLLVECMQEVDAFELMWLENQRNSFLQKQDALIEVGYIEYPINSIFDVLPYLGHLPIRLPPCVF